MPVEGIQGAGLGADLRVEGLGAEGAVGAAPVARNPESFGRMLEASLERLEAMVDDANAQSAALAAGEADDLTSVVLAVQRANLGVQLAVQVRNKAVEAYQELLRIQI